MSKSTKPYNTFYNNNFYYLFNLSMGEKYATSLTKYFAARYHIQVVRVDVKKKWGYGFLTSIVVRRLDKKEYEFSYADLPRLSLNDVEDIYGEQERIGTWKPDVKRQGLEPQRHQEINEMLDKIDQTLKRREQLRRLEEYVRGRPKTIDPCFFVRP
ncbi:hypothetical protein Tco_1133896 [Tanacetum coccineum]